MNKLVNDADIYIVGHNNKHKVSLQIVTSYAIYCHVILINDTKILIKIGDTVTFLDIYVKSHKL